jgi:hypothetical protein
MSYLFAGFCSRGVAAIFDENHSRFRFSASRTTVPLHTVCFSAGGCLLQPQTFGYKRGATLSSNAPAPTRRVN